MGKPRLATPTFDEKARSTTPVLADLCEEGTADDSRPEPAGRAGRGVKGGLSTVDDSRFVAKAQSTTPDRSSAARSGLGVEGGLSTVCDSRFDEKARSTTPVLADQRGKHGWRLPIRPCWVDRTGRRGWLDHGGRLPLCCKARSTTPDQSRAERRGLAFGESAGKARPATPDSDLAARTRRRGLLRMRSDLCAHCPESCFELAERAWSEEARLATPARGQGTVDDSRFWQSEQVGKWMYGHGRPVIGRICANQRRDEGSKAGLS